MLGFRVCEDRALDKDKRWVVLSVNDNAQTKLLLLDRATTDDHDVEAYMSLSGSY
jgi:hypothetical protein